MFCVYAKQPLRDKSLWWIKKRALNKDIAVEPRYFEVPGEMAKKFEIAGIRNNRVTVKCCDGFLASL